MRLDVFSYGEFYSTTFAPCHYIGTCVPGGFRAELRSSTILSDCASISEVSRGSVESVEISCDARGVCGTGVPMSPAPPEESPCPLPIILPSIALAIELNGILLRNDVIAPTSENDVPLQTFAKQTP